MSSSRLRRRGRPVTGRAVPAAERMRQMRARRKASGYRLEARWVSLHPDDGGVASPSDHRIHDIRSLAMHALIARKIDRDRALLEKAKLNLVNWRRRFRDTPPGWWSEWRRLLQLPWPQLSQLLTDPSEDLTRLRQSSPFAGILSPAERRKLHDAFRA